jgi:hypothetical protein
VSAERDVTRIVRSWLRTDEHESADRVLDIVLDRLDTTPQRRAWWPARRIADVNTYAKLLIAAAAIVVVAVIGINLLPAGTGVGGGPAATPTPSPSPSPTPLPAVGTNLGPPGTILRAERFSEPFTFTMPTFPLSPTTPISAEVSGRGLMRLVSDAWGSVSFHDDGTLPADMCLPTGARIQDVPATPDEVGRWLESSAGLEVSAPVRVTVDGRTGLRWDVISPKDVCDESASQPPPWFGAGEHHRIYAVPTGTDTILVITWGVNWSEGSEEYIDAVNAATDDLVRSMKFGG